MGDKSFKTSQWTYYMLLKRGSCATPAGVSIVSKTQASGDLNCLNINNRLVPPRQCSVVELLLLQLVAKYVVSIGVCISTEAAVAPVICSIGPLYLFSEDASCALSYNWRAYVTSPQFQIPAFNLFQLSNQACLPQ